MEIEEEIKLCEYRQAEMDAQAKEKIELKRRLADLEKQKRDAELKELHETALQCFLRKVATITTPREDVERCQKMVIAAYAFGGISESGSKCLDRETETWLKKILDNS